MASVPMMDIPRDKNYPADAVQCGDCGGLGQSVSDGPCGVCQGKGWLPPGHPRGRLCAYDACRKPLPPNHVAVYCTNGCALDDA